MGASRPTGSDQFSNHSAVGFWAVPAAKRPGRACHLLRSLSGQPSSSTVTPTRQSGRGAPHLPGTCHHRPPLGPLGERPLARRTPPPPPVTPGHTRPSRATPPTTPCSAGQGRPRPVGGLGIDPGLLSPTPGGGVLPAQQSPPIPSDVDASRCRSKLLRTRACGHLPTMKRPGELRSRTCGPVHSCRQAPFRPPSDVLRVGHSALLAIAGLTCGGDVSHGIGTAPRERDAMLNFRR